MPDLRDVTVLVAGLGVSGVAAARVLLDLGATVTLADAAERPVVAELTAASATWLGDVAAVPDGTGLVVTSPGWRPDHPLLADAARHGVEVVGEPELAWRLRIAGPDGVPAPWLAVTGTNGKTTTVTMLEAILLADGRRAVAAGNVGRPLVEVVTARDPDGTPTFDTVAVELSSFQLHWSSTLAPAAAAVLNVADDHTDWHGSFDAYRDAKARILERSPVAVADAGDPVAAALAAAHPNPVTVTLGEPGPGQVGVHEGALVDRAFGAGEVLLAAGGLQVPGPHNTVNALAAAALARAAGVPAEAVGRGLAGFRGGAHRNVLVGTVDGVDWVDDSKATNPHAAGASLASYPRVVWIAGGLLKGADVDPLVAAVASRLTGVVLLGRDRDLIAAALARHAPTVPVVSVPSGDDDGMDGTGVTAEATTARVVAAARDLARAGDTVLLAPAAASMDVYRDYAHRGAAFAAAVRALG